ncbi:MAG TPA: acyl-CoA reductase [Cyclobacteriaceae bacterium]
MKLEERIKAFNDLGQEIKALSSDRFKSISKKAEQQNPWFTSDNVRLAIDGICNFLNEDELRKWASNYNLNPASPKTVGVAMAGNIPLVGFHDYLSILMAGHCAQIKLSSQDDVLLPFLNELLLAIEPKFADRIKVEERLHDYDAAIATGSDNTGRYFSYYFKHVPHIIRKNRSSIAVLMGEETDAELEKLGDDIFSYFGLGCRNVSKLYLPEEYDLVKPLRVWEKFIELANHNKYANNYNYQRTINLVNQKHFYDNGVVLLIESEGLVSPISVIYYERYHDQEDLRKRIVKSADKLQCAVSANAWFNKSIDFGKAQLPDVDDYADNVDTLTFLSSLN